LQIDDEGKVTEEISDKMKKHVPVQTWKGWSPNDPFGGWFPALGGFKTLIGAMFLVLGAWNLFPLGTGVFRCHYKSHCRKKNSCSCNGAMKI
jgi:hypothetical protein